MKNHLDPHIFLKSLVGAITLTLLLFISGMTFADEEGEENSNIGTDMGEIYDMGQEYITIDDMGFRFAKSVKFFFENGKEAKKRYFSAGMTVEFSYLLNNNEIYEMRIVKSARNDDGNEAKDDSAQTKDNKEKATSGGGIYLKDGVWQN